MNDGSSSLYTTSTTPADPVLTGIIGLIYLLFIFVGTPIILISLWKVFTKAGRPGGAALIPFYNFYIMLKIIGRPGWWLLLIIFVPFVNIVIAIITYIDFAKAYGRSAVFGVFGLLIFPYIGLPMLGFGKSQYVGVNGVGPAAPAVPVAPLSTPPTTPPAA